MQNILFFLKKYLKDIVLVILVIIALGIASYALYSTYEERETVSDNIILANNAYITDEEKQFEEKIYVDVKGAVKKPGVYEVDNNTIINNVIKLAGGFKSNAYKNNINLSKKVSSEMVVYVYTKTEYAKSKDTNISSEEVICKTPDYNIDNCVDNKTSIIENGENKDLDNSKNDDKQSNSDNINNKTVVNINTADVKMLTSLSGIGESKAETIVDYRNKNGNFKSIDDIMNVSGIGEALFEKIKDYITV